MSIQRSRNCNDLVITRLLTMQRLDSYRTAADGDLNRALDLYSSGSGSSATGKRDRRPPPLPCRAHDRQSYWQRAVHGPHPSGHLSNTLSR
jgi:hypothetical protein